MIFTRFKKVVDLKCKEDMLEFNSTTRESTYYEIFSTSLVGLYLQCCFWGLIAEYDNILVVQIFLVIISQSLHFRVPTCRLWLVEEPEMFNFVLEYWDKICILHTNLWSQFPYKLYCINVSIALIIKARHIK